MKIAKLTIMFESEYDAKEVGVDFRDDAVCLLFPLRGDSSLELCFNEVGAEAVKGLLELYLKAGDVRIGK